MKQEMSLFRLDEQIHDEHYAEILGSVFYNFLVLIEAQNASNLAQ
jgi:hypothetical protein